MDKKGLLLRFLFGGGAVVVSYVVSVLLPWKEFGGIFAAFPAVMVVSVMMMALRDGTEKAAQTAQGAVFGMIGCAVSVLVVLLSIRYSHNWWLSVVLGLVAWYLTAVFTYRLSRAHRSGVTTRARNSRLPLPRQ